MSSFDPFVWVGILIAFVPAFALFLYVATGEKSMWLVFCIGAVGCLCAHHFLIVFAVRGKLIHFHFRAELTPGKSFGCV